MESLTEIDPLTEFFDAIKNPETNVSCYSLLLREGI
jgi:hypothetical protein